MKMFIRKLVAISLIIGFTVHRVATEPLYQKESNLKNSLLLTYDPTVPPNSETNDTTEVSIGMLLDLDNLDEDRGVLTSSVVIRLTWTDVRLKWNISEHGDLKMVAIPSSQLWRPDLAPYNNAMRDYYYSADYNAAVYPTGVVIFTPHIKLETRCKVDFEMYPFDEQNCKIRMGSWAYSGDVMTLKEGFGGIVTNDLVSNNHWKIVEASSTIDVIKPPCCPEKYYFFDVMLRLRRQAHHIVQLYVSPAVVIGLVLPVVFLLPSFSTYKMILGGTLLICQVLVSAMMAQSLPNNHSTVPRIAMYHLANIVLITLTLACSTVVILCQNKAKKGGPGVPGVIDKILGVLGKVFCARREDYIEDSDGDVKHLPVSQDSANVTQIDDSATMVKEYTRLVAPAEWRQLAVVLDRLLFVLFFLVSIITMASLVRYSY